MKTVVVGDLHGKYEIAQEVLDWDMPTVFVGDYMDSYYRSNLDQFVTLDTVLRAVKERDDVVGLLGNHELSYLDPKMRCGGYEWHKEIKLKADYGNVIEKLLLPYVWKEGFLISHAGVSQHLLTSLENKTLHQYLDEGDYNQIGVARGGYDAIGGLFWCDWRHEFAPVEGVSQIVGHTRGGEIRADGNNYCIDVLEEDNPQVVVIEDGEIVDTISV